MGMVDWDSKTESDESKKKTSPFLIAKMLRRAIFSIAVSQDQFCSKRIALSEKSASEERLAIDPDKLYLTLTALTWEQKSPATTEEKKLYGVDRAYSGNQNGDFFEGGRNVVWACSNPKCTNKLDKKWRQGTRRFLKYKHMASCPHCGSDKIFNWEKETFQTEGELLSRNQDGKFRYETWKGEPVNLNHDDKKVVGQIEDVWTDPPKDAIVELISIDRSGPNDNERVARKIESGQVESGSMELLTGIGMCSLCFNVHTSEDEFCDHLKNEKGLVNQRTGMHVFEICKSIQGCGHAICMHNDGADPNALVREVFASKESPTIESDDYEEFCKDMSSKYGLTYSYLTSDDKIPFDEKKLSLKEKEEWSSLKRKASETNLNSDNTIMASLQGKPDFSELKGKPDFSELKAAQTKKVTRTVEASRANVAEYMEDKPLPNMADMGPQLKAFGNYNSRRTAEEVRLANMTPAEREREARFAAWEKSQQTGSSAAISNQPTLRVSKEFLKNTFKTAVATKKITASAVVQTLVDFTANRKAFIASLQDRKLNSNSLKRLAIRKAQMKDEDDIKEMVLDVLGDALISFGEASKAVVSDVSYDDVGNSTDEAVGNPGDAKDFEDSLAPSDEHEDHEPSIHHLEDEHTEDEKPKADSPPDEDKNQDNEEDEDMPPMKKEAAAGIWPDGKIDTEKFPESNAVNKAEKLEKENGAGKGYTSTPKTEDFPKTSKQEKNPKEAPGYLGKNVTDGAALESLTKRKAALRHAIEEGTGDLDTLMDQLKKVDAQLLKSYPEFFTGDTEKFPETPKDLGGAINKNPDPVLTYGGNEQSNMKTETHTSGEGDDLGGDGQIENPKAPNIEGLARKASIPKGSNLSKLSAVQKGSLELQCIKAGLITADKKVIAKGMEGVSPADVKMLKEMGILPKDFKSAQLKTEVFPVSREGAQVEPPHLHEDNFGETEDFPKKASDATEKLKIEASKRQAEPTKPYDDKKFQEEKGIGVKTPKLDMYKHTLGTPTNDSDADKKMMENEGQTAVTKPGEAMKEMDHELDRKDGKEYGDEMLEDLGAVKIKPTIDDKKQDEDLGRVKPTVPNAAMHEMEKYRQIKSNAKVTAQFEKVEEKNQASSSNWTVFEDDEPILKIALKTAFPREVVARYNDFASEEYADTLITALKNEGIQKVNEGYFGGAGVTFTDSERTAMKKKAQAQQPAASSVQQNQPANVAPEVADKIMNDAKPGISVLDIVASQAAPIIAESDTLSVTTFIEELVNIGQSQDKITQLTDKLNEAVENLKNSAGMPEEPDSGTAPAVGEAPPNPNPQMATASRTISESEKKYAARLQAMRIAPIVREEQNCGLIDNYQEFLRHGCTKKEAAAEAKRVANERIEELMALPEESYLTIEKGIKTACRKMRSSRGINLPGENRDTALKKARWEGMKKEADAHNGTRILGNIPGPFTEAVSTMPKRHAAIGQGGLKFKTAHGVDPTKVEAALKARDNRDGRAARLQAEDDENGY
jgi:hypothetical protein